VDRMQDRSGQEGSCNWLSTGYLNVMSCEKKKNVEIDWSENMTLMFNVMGTIVGSMSWSGSGDDGI